MSEKQTKGPPAKDKAFIFRFLPAFVYGPMMKKLKATEHRVLWLLLDHADNADGTCYPGTARLAELSGMELRDVRRVLRGLTAKGVIATIKEGGGRRPGSHQGRATLRRLLIGSGVKPPSKHTGGGEPRVKDRIRGEDCSRIRGVKSRDTGGESPTDTRGKEPLPTPHSTPHEATHSNSGGGMGESFASRGVGRAARESTSLGTRKDAKRGEDHSDSRRPLSPIELALIEATGAQRNGEPFPEWLAKLTRLTSDLPESGREKLPAFVQDWYADAVTALEAGKDIPDPAHDADRRLRQRWASYGVTKVAHVLIRSESPERCEKMLAVCDKRVERDGGDRTIACRIAKSFAKNPSKFVPDDGESEYEGLDSEGMDNQERYGGVEEPEVYDFADNGDEEEAEEEESLERRTPTNRNRSRKATPLTQDDLRGE